MDFDCEGQDWEDTPAYYFQEHAESFETNGRSSGYFSEIIFPRQCREWCEAEAQQKTRFGLSAKSADPNRRQYALKRGRPVGHRLVQPSGWLPTGWSYEVSSPYWPRQLFGGHEFETPCLARPITRRWAAEPESERPYGPRPYELKDAQALALAIVAPSLSDDSCTVERLRDFKTHIAEQERHCGSTFLEKENPTRREFARGIRRAELDGIEQYRRHDQLRWQIDSAPTDYNDKPPEWIKEYRDEAQALRRRGRDSMIAVDQGFSFEDVDGTVARRRKRQGKTLRERKKPGPKNQKRPTPHGRDAPQYASASCPLAGATVAIFSGVKE
jgi:hypothetical protein